MSDRNDIAMRGLDAWITREPEEQECRHEKAAWDEDQIVLTCLDCEAELATRPLSARELAHARLDRLIDEQACSVTQIGAFAIDDEPWLSASLRLRAAARDAAAEELKVGAKDDTCPNCGFTKAETTACNVGGCHFCGRDRQMFLIERSEKESNLENEFIMQFFAYSHLPERLQEVSKPFCDLAHLIVDGHPGDPEGATALPRNPERTVALRKLLEAKDAAVRALVAK